MNIEQLRTEIEADEGRVTETYLCSLGHKTVGIGHLCREGEPEYEYELGTAVSDDRVNELFAKDIEVTLSDCKDIFLSWEQQPDEVKLILANMCFQLGKPRLSQFVKLIDAIESWPRNYHEAANQMFDSRWRRQTPARAKRLIDRMRAVDEA